MFRAPERRARTFAYMFSAPERRARTFLPSGITTTVVLTEAIPVVYCVEFL
jgi:hypothetical protein